MKEQPQSKKRCAALQRILLSNAVCPDRPAGGRQSGSPGMRKWERGGAGWGILGTAAWDGGNCEVIKNRKGCKIASGQRVGYNRFV